MKNLNLYIKKNLLLFTFVLSLGSLHAVELVNEQFTSDINGWSVSGDVIYSTNYSGSMRIDGSGNNSGGFNNRGWRTYSFGSSYVNQTLDIEVYWCAANAWESNNDYLRTKVNDSTVDTDYDGGGCQSRTFTANADFNGDFKIEFSTYVSATNEEAWIDWFTINTLTPSIDVCPGVVIPNLEGTSVTATDSFNNATIDYQESHFYHFTPAADGEFRIDFDADNSSRDVSVRIYDGCGNLLNGDEGDGDRVLIENVLAGHQIITEIYRRYDSQMDYDIDFSYIVSTPAPPVIANISDQTAQVGSPFNYTVTATDPNNDPITYTASGLPPGLTIDSTTGVISGTPTTATTYTVTVTATDTTSLSDTEVFDIIVSPIPAPNVTPATFTISEDAQVLDTVGTVSTTGGTPTSFSILSGNTDGIFQINDSGVITIVNTTNLNYSATSSYSLEIQASNSAGSHTGTIIIDITPVAYDFSSNNSRPFTKVPVAGLPHTNIAGDLLVIGNQSLCWMDGGTTCKKPGSDYSNNSYFQEHINLDPNAATSGYRNSTSANLTLNADDVVIEAWLYWIGRLDTNNETTRASAGTIRLKTPSTNGGYVTLTSHHGKFNWMVDDSLFDYGGAVNITEYVKEGGTYWVADLVATEMYNQGSGWAIAVIVADQGKPAIRSVKNISLYDGFNGVFNSDPYPAKVQTTISDFLTPSSGQVKSNIIVFAGESDRSLDDAMSLTRKDGTAVLLQDNLKDTNNLQNGTISRNGTNVTDRAPNYENTLGIDIDEIDVSGIIENGQTSTVITVDSYDDRIFLSMYGFATDLYIPEVCYDYAVSKNAFDITQDDRVISTTGTGELSITLALQSLEGDFDFINSQIGVRLVPTSNTKFTEAFYAPNNVNTLIPAIETASSTSIAPVIAIGEDVTVTGGTVKSEQRYFSAFNYELLGDYEGKFEVDLNTTINFGSGAVPIWQSSQFNDIPRCPQSDYYNPIKGAYNIERTDSGNYDSVSQPSSRYPLYTQVVGKDFDFHLVAYKEDPAPSFTSEIALTDYTVDIELINASPFSDDQSIFVCNNPSPSIIQTLNTNTGATNVFAKFPTSPSASSRIDLSGLDIVTDTALRNAAFRIWYIVDKNNTILPHQCASPSDNVCFQTLYDTHLKQDDIFDILVPAGNCSGYSNAETGKSGCYAYLRDFFSAAVCSRDNFAIRPASYRVGISDNNESTDPISPEILLGGNDTDSSVATLAAGYQYKLDGIATSFVSDSVTALGYNREFTIPSNSDLQSTLLYDTTNNSASCTDKNNTDWNVDFDNGQIQNAGLSSNNLVIHSNVGEYYYHIEDANWTLVDQSRYAFKTFPGVDDCLVSSNIPGTSTSMSGCIINSILDVNGITYTDLHVTYQPYKFDLSGVNYIKHPDNGANHTYMNDFDNSYYDDLLEHPVDMSISFEGNISAFGKNDVLLTNFSDGCKAEDITLNLFRTTSPEESTLADFYGNSIEMQQYLQHTSRYINPFADEQIGMDKNITLPSAGFSDTVAQGTAEMFLHTTFKKPLNAPVNPFNIQYETLKANGGTLLSSSAGMVLHIPEGNNTYDQNTTYYFTKVTPLQKVYEDVSANFKTTPIFVDIYCSLGADCNTSYNLSVPTKGLDEVSEWYYASMFDNINDGTTDLFASHYAGVNASPVVAPNDDVSFTSDTATQNDVVVALTGAGRPSTVDIEIIPDPWLLYDPTDPDGYPHYQVDFIDSGWSGVGNTGRVGDTKSSTESSSRMNW